MRIKKIDNFEFSERYGIWCGSVMVKGNSPLFEQEEIYLTGHYESKGELTEEACNVLYFFKQKFMDIYLMILRRLFELQQKGEWKYEIFNERDLTFSPITFVTPEEIHPYLGMPTFEIIPDASREQYHYFVIHFHRDCLLSIEHGFSFLFYKEELIDMDVGDSYNMVNRLKRNL